MTGTDQAAGTSRLPVFNIPLEGDILHRWARLKGSSSELRGLFFWRPFYPAPVPWGLNEYALLSKQCRFLFWDAHRQQEKSEMAPKAPGRNDECHDVRLTFANRWTYSESINKLFVSDILQRAWTTSRGTTVLTCLLLISWSVER